MCWMLRVTAVALMALGLLTLPVNAQETAPAATPAPAAQPDAAPPAATSADPAAAAPGQSPAIPTASSPEAAANPAAQSGPAQPQPGGTDWTYWRGPQMNGVSTEVGLPDKWDPEGGEGSNLVWMKEELGTRSTPVVMNGRLYVLCRDKPETEEEGEKLVCADAATGNVIWEQRWNVYLSDVPDTRVAWSACVADPESNQVYALGVCGLFSCFRADTGKPVWRHSLHEEYGLLSTYGGRTNYPILFEDTVIISAVMTGWGEYAKPTHRFIAFDKYNGQPVWFEGTTPLPEDTTYSAPVIGVADGQTMLYFGAGDGKVWGFNARTGKPVWSYQLSERGVNCAPVLYEGKVYCGHSEENPGRTEMGAMACVDAATGQEIWKNYEQFVGKNQPIVVEGVLIAIEDGGKVLILDPDTGKLLNKKKTLKVDTVMRGSPLYADGKLYCCGTNGRFWTYKVKIEGEGENRKVDLEPLDSHRLDGYQVDGSPICAQGRIYFPGSHAMYCIGKPDAQPMSAPVPPLPPEAPRDGEQKPALLRVVPVESLLMPGDRQQLDIRLYNDKGQWLRNAHPSEVSFNVQGAGEVSADGKFSTDKAAREHAAAVITAKVGEVTGIARARIVPNFPWSVDFNNGQIPITWVGVRYRHVPIDFDLYQKIAAEDKQASQLYIYFTSEFVNFAPKRDFDDSTPAQRWTEVLKFLDLTAEGKKPKNLEEARKQLDASLQKLVDLKVLASFDWTTWDRTDGGGNVIKEPKLAVAQGERKIEGNGVMCKITTIPKGTRSQGWMGQTDLKDYTIQADVYAPEHGGRMPDIGLIAQRYCIDLQGASQRLQIRTWHAVARMAKEVPFAWQPDTWYTLKLRASNENGKDVLRGKVWKKGEAEPAEWTVTAEDPVPNLTGSPGFFANATLDQVFYDNVSVTPNTPLATPPAPQTTGGAQ